MKVQHYAGLVFFGVLLNSFAMEENSLPAYLNSSIPLKEKLYRAILNDAPQEIEEAAKNLTSPIDECVIYRGLNHMSPLWWALSLVRPKAVRALLTLGANPNTPETKTLLSAPEPTSLQAQSTGMKPVHYAAVKGDMESTLALIQYDADSSGYIVSIEPGSLLNTRDIMGCVLENYVEDEEMAYQVVKELFAKGYRLANHHKCTNIWFNAIYKPVGRYPLNQRLLALLIAQKANVNESMAFDHGNIEVTPLGYAIQTGAVEAVACLLAAGARIDQKIKRQYEARPKKLLDFAQERVNDQRPNAERVLLLLQERVAKK